MSGPRRRRTDPGLEAGADARKGAAGPADDRDLPPSIRRRRRREVKGQGYLTFGGQPFTPVTEYAQADEEQD